VPDKLERLRTPGDARWSYFYSASSLYFQREDGILCIDFPVQPSSGEGPYDGIDGSISDVDCAVFVRYAVEREFWEKE